MRHSRRAPAATSNLLSSSAPRRAPALVALEAGLESLWAFLSDGRLTPAEIGVALLFGAFTYGVRKLADWNNVGSNDMDEAMLSCVRSGADMMDRNAAPGRLQARLVSAVRGGMTCVCDPSDPAHPHRPCVCGSFEPTQNQTAHQQLVDAADLSGNDLVGGSIKSNATVGLRSETLNRTSVGQCDAAGTCAGKWAERELRNGNYKYVG